MPDLGIPGPPVVVPTLPPAVYVAGQPPIAVLPVPGPEGSLDLPIDEHGRFIIDGGPPANGTGA